MRVTLSVLSFLILMLTAGCSRTAGISAEQSALDNAYKAGVLTKAEYEAKKATLAQRTGALDALNKARDAGLLTKDEYESKRSALLASQPAAAPVAEPVTAQTAPTPVVEAPSSTPTKATSQPPTTTSSPSASMPPPEPAQPSTQPPTPAHTTAAAASTQDHVFRMKMIKAIDAQGFERPLTSASMLVPVDWQPQGGTTWHIKDKCNSIQTTLQAYGPDGRGIEVFPAFNWYWADDSQAAQMSAAQTARMGMIPCTLMPPMSASDYLRRNLNRLRPNAQVVSIEPARKLMDVLQQRARQAEQAATQYRLQQRVKPDAVRARLRFNHNGQPVEEWLYVTTITTGTLGPSYDTRTMQMRQAWTYSNVAYATAERAPQGKLDESEKLFDVIVNTYRIDPAWQARVTNNALQLQQTELKGIRDRANIVSKNADDIAKIRREQYENQQKSQDHISAQFSEYQRGVETYRNPATGETVELSNLYGNAWVNNRGEYLLSDQASFDPSVVFKEDWKPLEHVKK